jgi:hypothetical protein
MSPAAAACSQTPSNVFLRWRLPRWPWRIRLKTVRADASTGTALKGKAAKRARRAAAARYHADSPPQASRDSPAPQPVCDMRHLSVNLVLADYLGACSQPAKAARLMLFPAFTGGTVGRVSSPRLGELLPFSGGPRAGLRGAPSALVPAQLHGRHARAAGRLCVHSYQPLSRTVRPSLCAVFSCALT